MLTGFPHEAIPDGTVWVAHHFIYLSAAAFIAALTVWDDYRKREPLYVAGGLAVGLFAFQYMWPIRGYHALGAALALTGPVVAIAACLNPRGDWMTPEDEGGYPFRTAVLVVLLSIGALDDAVEHAFGVWTPLDWFFNTYGVTASFAGGVVVSIAAIVIGSAWGRVPWGEITKGD